MAHAPLTRHDDARLHDGSRIEVTVRGDGPALLLPVRTTPLPGPQADATRAWGGDPDAGSALATRLADAGFRVVTADYEGHLAEHPKPATLTAEAVTADLLAVADVAGAERFAWYGYSWLALAGLQLALRTDRITALAMGGFPPLEGPYEAMLAVTRAAHARSTAQPTEPPDDDRAGEVEPGDWDAAAAPQDPALTRQYLTLYESLAGFDDHVSLTLDAPRLVLVGADDDITYGPAWGDVDVVIAGAVVRHRAELESHGWEVAVLPGMDHMAAMHASAVLPVLEPWLSPPCAPKTGRRDARDAAPHATRRPTTAPRPHDPPGASGSRSTRTRGRTPTGRAARRARSRPR
ncbi:alpha/beta hydrolase [Isoptericola sp. NEAU-Y5]|uniref:Alpha/beta hydrolase n=1 Tax=Isoptericola luteus TaxID=2879484 RepID=A0ABS7ZBK3_9MICO|nr:alpha/beta hydrolase [Isoptericola sp. NEAU-Y5]MCA5892412.1 alpha/beta hydrolase [Isoptericola sp. NEAU-Y5]